MEPLEARRLLDGLVLDQSFGWDGRVVMPFADGRLIGPMPGGKILISRYNPSRGGNQLMRLNADGSPDPTFTDTVGDFGMNAGRIHPANGRILYIAPQRADHWTNIAVLRADGTRDTSFGGGDGMLDVGSASVSFLQDLEWQGDKVLYQANERITRLNADGSLDATFGDGGIMQGIEGATDFHLDAAGRIYQVEHEFVEDEPPPLIDPTVQSTARIVRFTADGELDTSYGEDGRTVANQTSSLQVRRATVQVRVAADGSVIHIMNIFGGESMTRLDPDGDVAARHEYATHPDARGFEEFRGSYFERFLVPQPDGKVLLITAPVEGSWQVTRLDAT